MASKHNRIKTLHVGKLINQVRQEKRVSYATLSRLMNRHHTGINTALKRETLQASVIWEFSLALRHNFFEDLAAELQENTDVELDSSNAATAQTIAQLETENQRLKEELHYLRLSVKALADKVG